MAAGPHPLEGRRILVVEDVLLLADLLRDQLEDCGCTVVGPVPRLAPAMTLARDELLDGAILDVNVCGEFSFPVAAILEERHIPYVFLTGYDDKRWFPVEYRNAPCLGKPYRSREFVELLTAQLGRA